MPVTVDFHVVLLCLCQAALLFTQIVGQYVYDTCGETLVGKSSCRFIFRV